MNANLCKMISINQNVDRALSASKGDFYSISQAARYLGVNPSTIWRWIEAERLQAYRVGPRTIRIKKDDLDQIIRPTAAAKRKEETMNEFASSSASLAIRPLSDKEREHGLQVLRAARQLRRRICERRGGKMLSSSWELIREAREERAKQL